MRKKGISLIVLIITIIVIIILAGAIVLALVNGGVLDSATKASFMSDYRSVEDAVGLYSVSKIDPSNPNAINLPLEGKLSASDKLDITNNVPTLKTKIEELNPGKTLNDIDLYWINEQEIGIGNLQPKKQSKGYIIDVATKQIYDYVGDFFENKRWHTLDSGVEEVAVNVVTTQEMWDGWMKLTLYYPANATDKQWRLGSVGEIRVDPLLMWQDYTGPISVPLDRVKDVWIKYKVGGTQVTIPPAGTLLVDIVPDKTGSISTAKAIGDEDLNALAAAVTEVNVTINYDTDALTKEYKIGNSGWMTYTGPFIVTENCMIQARATKTEYIYNTDGSLLMSRDLSGDDKVYIGNIGPGDPAQIEESSLPAPTITRLSASNGSEKARVQVTYPAEAVRKVFKINYGVEEEYTSEISIANYGTHVIAYYYDANGKRSLSTSIYINDTSTGLPPSVPKPYEPLPPYKPDAPIPYGGDNTVNLPAPTITRLSASNGSEKARIQVTYPANATRKIYTENYGAEQSYTSEISITSWGTYIMAYYFDVYGNKSQISWIRVNEAVTPPSTLEPTPIDPTEVVPPPTINLNPSSGITSQVTVSVTSPLNANKTYIKLGRYADYQEYTSSIVVRNNMEIYAYYVKNDGKQSLEAKSKVGNIQVPGPSGTSNDAKPYVNIDANPYPYTGSSKQSLVNITIQYSAADKIEYSEDGIVYKPYVSPFAVTKNERIYARGTNTYGVTEAYLDITNIGSLKPPTPIQSLAVNINVNPEPSLSTVQVAKATVSIEYDTKATEKYYRIGASGDLISYTGAFDVDKNCTIYAYAKGTNASGQAAKTVDNLVDGIADPKIISLPANLSQASKVSISIEFDKNATMKRYSIDGGVLLDYTVPFDVTKNGTKIYAYSKNIKGQISSSTYTVENIIPEPPVLVLDKGYYYLLKLSYPDGSTGREYKWTANGVWGTYKDAGILLIKPQYKDQMIQNGTLVKIEDETGKIVTFTGDYYFITVPVSEMSENIFMRWNRVAAAAPEIVLDTTQPAKQVSATVIYDQSLIKKQYRIQNPGEPLGNWQDYTSPITIDKNNAVIYAKGMDESEVWSAEGKYKVINIDETAPVIKLTADLDTAQQKVAVKVNVTDDVEVGKVKWSSGIQGESYFTNSGTEILNNSVVNITSNGYYTFYAEDKVGNTQVYTLNVTNVDLTPPIIDIAVSPENTVGTSANVTINYGDSTTKQYKIGTSNATWTNYTSGFNISSYTILSNNWQNADGTVTVYAKGKDSSGNEITVQKKVLSLDLDMPKVPVIKSNASYPILASYGVIFDDTTTITYDTRNDINNYYSTDNGTTWRTYTGTIHVSSGTVIAKSVKKNSGLDISVSQTVTIPPDAIKSQVYDGNLLTSVYNVTNQYMGVDVSMQGMKMRVKWNVASNGTLTGSIVFLDENKSEISRISKTVYNQNIVYDEIYSIPANAKWIRADNIYYLYEIQTSNEPTFSSTNEYMLLTLDSSKTVKQPYQMITINYFPTSAQRLYSIGAGGTWLSYTDQPVKLNQGETIYAKGVDQYGNETRTISSYTANVTDALTKEAFDGNDTTYVIGGSTKYLKVDSSMQGKSVRFKWVLASGISATANVAFLDVNKQQISNLNRSVTNNTGYYDENVVIPANTVWITYTAIVNGYSYMYEIGPANEPIISATNGYMLLTADPANAIKDPYQSATITYYPTSVQKLYRIGTTGAWLNYTNQPVKVNQGQTIYAKGIDQYGVETRIISSYTANVTDALTKEIYDGNDFTGISNPTNKFMEVDSSMQGRNIRVKWNVASNGTLTGSIIFLDANMAEISRINKTVYNQNIVYDEIYTVPSNAKYIKEVNVYYFYEIQPANEPTFTTTNGYMYISKDVAKQVRQPYQAVTINYFPTSVQKLYQIGGTTGTWLNYTGPITLTQGQVIYAKGIDVNGNATRLTPSFTINVPDALGNAAYDGSDTTYFTGTTNRFVQIDPALQGASVRFKWTVASGISASAYIIFMDQNRTEISRVTRSVFNNIGNYNEMLTIPANTYWIVYNGQVNGYSYLYEIAP